MAEISAVHLPCPACGEDLVLKATTGLPERLGGDVVTASIHLDAESVAKVVEHIRTEVARAARRNGR